MTHSQVGTPIGTRLAKSAGVYLCVGGLLLPFLREPVFGSFSHRGLRFGENQVWRFAPSTCSFEVEKEKRRLFPDSEGGSGMIFASCKTGFFANDERPARVRNKFSITLSRSEGGSSEETTVSSNCASNCSCKRS